jgi:CheY-like chemotaxis protein/HPt (histidine-containing phosphotransfer) domain-containing protein
VSVVESDTPCRLDGSTERRVLLVEDDEICQDIVLLMLGRLGYQADVVNDGVDAVWAVQAKFYDVVLMDVRMPRMNGVEAAHLIRSTLNMADQPLIIAMTADTTNQCLEDCLQAGMNGHLDKPVHIGELAAALEYWFDRQDTFEMPHGDSDEHQTESVPASVVYDDRVLEMLLDDLDGDEAMRADLIESFILDSQKRLAAIVVAGNTGDLEALAFQAHAIKSASATIGLLALSEVTHWIEAEVRTRPDEVDVGLQASLVVTEYGKAIRALTGRD